LFIYYFKNLLSPTLIIAENIFYID